MEQSDPLYRRDLLRLAGDATGAGQMNSPDATATAHNPACGDRVTVALRLERDGRIAALTHTTHACVLTQASAALLAATGPGLDRAGLEALEGRVRTMLKDGAAPPPGYEVFDGVATHGGRHVCVLLPIEAALRALEQSPDRSGR
jgi:NifU-like protein involved in Fe-S cluster formation